MNEDIKTSRMVTQEEAVWILHMDPYAYMLKDPIYIRGIKCRLILFKFMNSENFLYCLA